MMAVAAAGRAATLDDDRDWKLNEKETIRRTFDARRRIRRRKLLVDNVTALST